MSPGFKDSAVAAVRNAEGPLTAGQIASVVKSGKKAAAPFVKEIAETLAQLPGSEGVFEWPRYGASRLFSKTLFRGGVEDAFLKSLESGPLTIKSAAAPVVKLLRRVSEARALAELKAVAPQLAAAKRVVQVAVNRQSIIYLSYAYLGNLLPERRAEDPMAAAIQAAVKRLEPGPGNYVRIDHLRNSSELRTLMDDAAIALMEQGELVLTHYDGPRPVPDDEKWNFVEDRQGELFIAIAYPRRERSQA